jgi:hypothetical protein
MKPQVIFRVGSPKLQRVWRNETERLHQLAVEIAQLPNEMRFSRLATLEQWERMQVMDEIRHPEVK